MWLLFAILSAIFLGFYDVFKKKSLTGNAVPMVLLLNTVFCALIFLPAIVLSAAGTIGEGSFLHVPPFVWAQQRCIVLKAFLVLASWGCGYIGIKHLPLTIVGPIHATRPIMVLVGALLLFGERLNLWQWAGVTLGIISLFMLAGSGHKEGIHFGRNRYVWLVLMAAILGAASALFDRFLLAPLTAGGMGIANMTVQAYTNIYQSLIMAFIVATMAARASHPEKSGPSASAAPFRWTWYILGISVALSVADFAYYYALSQPGAMVSIVSMLRRGSVLVSFTFGAIIFHERNLRSKAFDLLFILLSMLFLYFGTQAA